MVACGSSRVLTRSELYMPIIEQDKYAKLLRFWVRPDEAELGLQRCARLQAEDMLLVRITTLRWNTSKQDRHAAFVRRDFGGAILRCDMAWMRDHEKGND